MLLIVLIGLIIYCVRRSRSKKNSELEIKFKSVQEPPLNSLINSKNLKYEAKDKSESVQEPPLNIAEMENLSYIEVKREPLPIGMITGWSNREPGTRAQTENLNFSGTKEPNLLKDFNKRNNSINYTVLSPATLNELHTASLNELRPATFV